VVASFALQYDGKGRRENDTGGFTGTNYYLDDKSTSVVSKNVNGSTTTAYDYETIPGSGEVAGRLGSTKAGEVRAGAEYYKCGCYRH